MSSSSQPRIPLTTVGRPLDRKSKSNRAIMIVFFAVLVLGAVALRLQGAPLSFALMEGLILAGAVFFGWMLGREIDPDRPYSAFVAAAFAGAGAFFLGQPHFLLLFWIVIALRFINRTSGEGPGALDFAGFYGIKVWLGLSTHWTIPLLTLPTMLFAGLERFPKWLRVVLPAVLPIAGIVFGFIHRWRFVPLSLEQGRTLLLATSAVAVASIPVLWSYRTVRSVGDRTGKPLDPQRVQWAITWAVSTGIILTLVAGMSFADLAPLWGALVGAFIGWIVESTTRRIGLDRSRRDVRTKIARKK